MQRGERRSFDPAFLLTARFPFCRSAGQCLRTRTRSPCAPVIGAAADAALGRREQIRHRRELSGAGTRRKERGHANE